MDWRLQPDDMTINAVEIGGPPFAHPARGDLRVTLAVPGLTPATTAFAKAFGYSVLTGLSGKILARAYYTPNQMPDGTWRDGIVIIVRPTCLAHLGESFTPPGAWRIASPADVPDGAYDLSGQRDDVIGDFRGGVRQSWFDDPAYRHHDDTGCPIPDDAANGADPKVLRAGTINSYATGTATSRAGASCRETGRETIHTGHAVGGTSGTVWPLWTAASTNP